MEKSTQQHEEKQGKIWKEEFRLEAINRVGLIINIAFSAACSVLYLSKHLSKHGWTGIQDLFGQSGWAITNIIACCISLCIAVYYLTRESYTTLQRERPRWWALKYPLATVIGVLFGTLFIYVTFLH